MSVTDGIGQTPCSFEHYLVYENSRTSVVYYEDGRETNQFRRSRGLHWRRIAHRLHFLASTSTQPA